MSDKVTVRCIAASAMVVNLLVWCIAAQAQDRYDINRTVTIEAEGYQFCLGDTNAMVTLTPIGKPQSSETSGSSSGGPAVP